jgi:hypothetical protein
MKRYAPVFLLAAAVIAAQIILAALRLEFLLTQLTMSAY